MVLHSVGGWSNTISLVPRSSSVREERGRVWNITPSRSVPKEYCAQVIMTHNLAFVVLRVYEECKLCSILLKHARARAVHAACFAVRPFEYSGLTPCIVANQHLSRNFCLRDTSARGYVLAHWRVWGRDYICAAMCLLLTTITVRFTIYSCVF